NKIPRLRHKIGLLSDVFPRSRIVHIVREDLSVVASTKIHFERNFEGVNFCRVPFRAYWPEEPELPCWYMIPAGYSRPRKEPLKRRIKNLLIRRPRVPAPRHEDPEAFKQVFPDESRYYPGDGFARIPESWLRINANIIRQIDLLGMQHRYLPINYANLVEDTLGTMERIASFCEFDLTDSEAIPKSLDRSRRNKWRRDLTHDQQRIVVAVTERLESDAELIRSHLPGPLCISCSSTTA
ncbi:MAG: hypothetical protein IID41_17935, partial [Planctomycetes bacterium]|nr:hypothetical protein [Planctomycetota bacterium]